MSKFSSQFIDQAWGSYRNQISRRELINISNIYNERSVNMEKLYVCPMCGDMHTQQHWEEMSDEHFDDDPMTFEESDRTTFYYCTSCSDEVEFRYILEEGSIEVTGRDYICPSCLEPSSADEWNEITRDNFGGGITEIQESRDSCHYTCPKCKETSSIRDIIVGRHNQAQLKVGDQVVITLPKNKFEGAIGVVKRKTRISCMIEFIFQNEIMSMYIDKENLIKVGEK